VRTDEAGSSREVHDLHVLAQRDTFEESLADARGNLCGYGSAVPVPCLVLEEVVHGVTIASEAKVVSRQVLAWRARATVS
jgi:hypothetical protein